MTDHRPLWTAAYPRIGALRRALLSMVLAVCVPQAWSQPVYSCTTTDLNFFNTGYNGAGGILANGAHDANWKVTDRQPATNPANLTSMPPAGTTWYPALVGNPVPGSWSASPYNNAQWISREYPNTSATGDWYYRFDFVIDPAVDASALALPLSFMADNTLQNVFINGQPQDQYAGSGLPQNSTTAPYTYQGYRWANRSALTLRNNWQSGLNTIIMQVKSGAPYEGFMAQFVPPTPSCPPAPQVAVTKSASLVNAAPGQTTSFTIDVVNTGTVAATNLSIVDAVPAGLTNVTWTCTGAACPIPSTGSGEINASITSLPVGESLSFAIQATVDPGIAAGSQITNTASVSRATGLTCGPAGSTGMPGPCTATAQVTAVLPQVTVTKTASTTTLIPGGTVVYTLTVANSGTVPATNTRVVDDVPTGINAMNWSCTRSDGIACLVPSGPGPLDQTIPTLPPTVSVTYTINATVSATPPAVIVNTANVTPGDRGICDPGNTPPPCTASASVPPVAQISLTKTASTTTLTPGGSIVYTLTVANGSQVAANGTTVNDPMANGLTEMSWTCAASGGGVCPQASGSDALNQTIASLPGGASLVYTITATVSATPPAVVTNTASITPGDGGVCLPDNTAAPCTASASVPPAPPSTTVAPVPTLGELTLMTLALALAGLGAARIRDQG